MTKLGSGGGTRDRDENDVTLRLHANSLEIGTEDVENWSTSVTAQVANT